MKVSVNLKEVTSPVSFVTKYYDVVARGVINNAPMQMNDDFDKVYTDWSSAFINCEMRALKNPQFDFFAIAKHYSKSTIFMEFTNEDDYNPDRITLLIKGGKVYEIPCALKDVDISFN